jgi:hypothetical protein
MIRKRLSSPSAFKAGMQSIRIISREDTRSVAPRKLTTPVVGTVEHARALTIN